MTVSAHQILHGYADGHRLLAGSIELPQAPMRALLIHSDGLAGPRGQMALSSLPLPEFGLWAITGTWRAEEMPRPGSVWSHTLVFDNSAIAELRHAGGVLDVFRRPSGVGDLAPYRQPLLVPERPAMPKEPAGEQVTAAVLMAFYSWPEQPAAVIVPQLPLGEAALLAVWEQQWPELRAAASFTARGRLEPDSKSEVQLAAVRARSRPPIPVIDSSRELPEEEPQAWIGALVADIKRPGSLRAFLADYGPQGERGRGDVSLLVELERGFSSSSPVKALVRLIHSYPKPPQMNTLKQSALEAKSQVWPGPDHERLLAAYTHHRHILWPSLRLGERLARLWPERPTVLVECLRLAQEDKQLAADAWEATAARADGSMLAYLAETELDLAVELARRRPELLLGRQLWQPTHAWQQRLALAIAEREGLDPALASVLIDAGNTTLAAELRRQDVLGGRELAAAIAAQGLSEKTAHTYRQVFGDAKDEAVRHALLKEASWVERILGALLGDIRNPILSKHSDQLAKHLHQLDEASRLELATRLMLAQGDQAVSKAVMQSVFPVLHRALVSQSLPDRHWKRLDKTLPSGNHWDRAERLRKALLESIKQQNWTEQDVAQVIEQAGPEAEKLRDLTKKKSDLRKAIDAARDLITPWW